MTPQELTHLLEEVREGRLSVADGASRLEARTLDLGHSRLDLQRERRCGHAEVVFAEGKTVEEVVEVARALVEHHGRVLVTRLSGLQAAALRDALPRAVHHERARLVTVGMPEDGGEGDVVVASAGTSDAPVAQEAALTARFLGARVRELRDVGVAGLHRLLAEVDTLRSARVVVVVAGMEGALPSVVGGLVDRPVVAVPTSVGYGANFEGLSALLGMLNSCAAGVTVVNIDNGFGAGYAAAQINRTREESRR